MTSPATRPDAWLSVAGARNQGPDSRWLVVIVSTGALRVVPSTFDVAVNVAVTREVKGARASKNLASTHEYPERVASRLGFEASTQGLKVPCSDR